MASMCLCVHDNEWYAVCVTWYSRFCVLIGLGICLHAWLVMCAIKKCTMEIFFKYQRFLYPGIQASAPPLLWWLSLLIIHREFNMVSYCVFVDPLIFIVTNLPSGIMALRALWVEWESITFSADGIALAFYFPCTCTSACTQHTLHRFVNSWSSWAWENLLSLSECRRSIPHIHPPIYLQKLHVSCYLWWDSRELWHLSSFSLIIAVIRIKALKLDVYSLLVGLFILYSWRREYINLGYLSLYLSISLPLSLALSSMKDREFRC